MIGPNKIAAKPILDIFLNIALYLRDIIVLSSAESPQRGQSESYVFNSNECVEMGASYGK
jgi:hypothetical protein